MNTKMKEVKGRKFGYVRVSTIEQETLYQKNILTDAGVRVTNIYTDKKSGKNIDREGFIAVLSKLKSGDEFIVSDNSRLSRDVKDTLKVLDSLLDRGVTVNFLTQALRFVPGEDAVNNTNRMVLTMLASVAENYRLELSRKTKLGLKAAREQGRVGGNPRRINLTPYQLSVITELYEAIENKNDVSDKVMNKSKASRLLSKTRVTINSWLKYYRENCVR